MGFYEYTYKNVYKREHTFYAYFQPTTKNNNNNKQTKTKQTNKKQTPKNPKETPQRNRDQKSVRFSGTDDTTQHSHLIPIFIHACIRQWVTGQAMAVFSYDSG